ncbi:hypothetical protein HBB16_02685 [Pseudonocardia sp. MCCB 268]|nr:hypothetical protein [Pseudonocardia cytotoxica]
MLTGDAAEQAHWGHPDRGPAGRWPSRRRSSRSWRRSWGDGPRWADRRR